jgi:hypothetical protein
MLPDAIAQRSEAIRLDKKRLARLANLSQKSTGMTLRGQSSPRLSNLLQLEKALLGEELRLRDYLLSLHPLPRTDEERAA